MTANEVVKALRACGEIDCSNCTLYRPLHGVMCAHEAAALIESMQAELEASQRRAQDARNELCLKCGRYHEAHNGACDGCRWKG